MRKFVRLGVAAGATALSLTLAACSGSSSSSAGHDMSSMTSSGMSASASASVDAKHNAADVTFAQNMIVHHQGAVQMAQMAATKAATQEVKDLAERIKAAQGPEIQKMTSWLKAWGEPLTAESSMSDMGNMGGSSGSSGSMGSTDSMGMSQEQMDQLDAASGKDFDRMFLQMMTAHHRGAIELARTEQANGSNPQAIALAKSIETSQGAEVAEMGQMLQSVGS